MIGYGKSPRVESPGCPAADYCIVGLNSLGSNLSSPSILLFMWF